MDKLADTPHCANQLTLFASCCSVTSTRSFHIARLESHSVDYFNSEDKGSALRPALEAALYRCYARSAAGTAPAPMSVARDFVLQLSAANDGTGSWQRGWSAGSTHGDLTQVSSGPFNLWVGADELRADDPPADGKPVAGVSIRVPKERRYWLPGFYLAVGNSAHVNDDQSLLTRIYWNVPRRAAARVVHEITTALNSLDTPFLFKIASDPGSFQRADTAVLYIDRDFYTALQPTMMEIHRRIEAVMRPTTPYFVKQIGKGLGVAESRGELSFGQRCCKHVAAALCHAFEYTRNREEDRLLAMRRGFLDAGFDPDRLYLEVGSTDIYASRLPEGDRQ